MPHYTNHHNLPAPLVRALTEDGYSKGLADCSVTEIISSPRQKILAAEHEDDIVMDVADRFWSVLGVALHTIIENGSNGDPLHRAEERLYGEVGGWIVSGGIDLQLRHDNDDVILTDWKSVGVWAVMNPKKEWAEQLNCYAYLAERAGLNPIGLRIGAMMRDWKAAEIGRQAGYPLSPIVMVDIPLWSAEERARYIAERVRIHQDAQRDHALGDPLPECDASEMWERDGQWAVIKKGAKRASRVFGSQTDAEQYAVDAAAKDGTVFRIEHRPGERIKCQSYCPASPFCDQFARYKELKNE